MPIRQLSNDPSLEHLRKEAKHLAAINARRKNGGTLLDVALRRDRDFAEALRCCGAETRKS